MWPVDYSDNTSSRQRRLQRLVYVFHDWLDLWCVCLRRRLR